MIILEIKVNDYVRTKDGIIDKVIIEYNGHCASPNCNCKHVSCERNYYDEDKIIKTSPNIIDLIEVGDYVNGYKVVDKGKYEYDGNQSYIVIDFNTDNDELHWGDVIELTNDNIKSIVTKEQFEQMEYKIEIKVN